MKYVAVLPYVWPPYFQECVATMAPELRENTLFVDNTANNVGIMKAHNMGIDFMKQRGADFLIIISAAVRFGENAGLDFIQQIEDHQDHHVIHAASENVAGGKQADPEGGGHNEVFGWHLTAFHKSVFEQIGRWDQNFTPYGFDDIDLSIRIRKHFKETTKWDTYPCDVHDTTMSHSINLAGVESPSGPRILYFVEKWGRHPGAYQLGEYEHPFNNAEHSLAYWPPAADGGKWDE